MAGWARVVGLMRVDRRRIDTVWCIQAQNPSATVPVHDIPAPKARARYRGGTRKERSYGARRRDRHRISLLLGRGRVFVPSRELRGRRAVVERLPYERERVCRSVSVRSLVPALCQPSVGGSPGDRTHPPSPIVSITTMPSFPPCPAGTPSQSTLTPLTASPAVRLLTTGCSPLATAAGSQSITSTSFSSPPAPCTPNPAAGEVEMKDAAGWRGRCGDGGMRASGGSSRKW
ncbi:hypothetical protein CALCODRAFT_182006 [Calocera cornea HHB12733]|uniref:Uncharacterized protein n=1 Tax=Calocera cornea HHB12733 TaxID=1353952 RepID=A0A165HRX1_9BASI|nr:hypothetical protein CALCODRAFT_182006 [Calocera cornea HHB12733]